ncbi:murein biosynthesis integral membrane protein MurJ [Bhargavaea ullalensis]|uniref:Peptidoglycan lipid II flippase n=1 Tax=Bhargavaea ullalensis TaxID=1265685 RepID=A0ABV2GBF1_9BACL
MNKFMKIIGAVAVINIVARLFGFAREMLIGYQFGTGRTADSIITAYTVPNFIYLVVGGALTTAFISVYHRTEGDRRAFVRETFTGITAITGLLTVGLMIGAAPVLRLLFGGLEDAEYALTLRLYLWMMPSAVFLVLSTWLSGLLNVNQKFHLSSVAILIYNALFFVIPFALTGSSGPDAYGYGALLAAVVMAAFLFLGLRRLGGYSFRPKRPSGGDQKLLWKMALPIMFGGATLQFYFLIHRIYSSQLGEGAVAAVNYASKLTQFPQAILMTAVTTVIYPLLSQKVGEGDRSAVESLYGRGLRLLALLLIPAAIYIWFFAGPVTGLVFGRGSFTAESVAFTAPIVRLFGLSIFFISLNTYITRFYYAEGNSAVPVLFSIVSVFAVNIAVIKLLIGPLGVGAVAWGTGVSSAVNSGLLIGYASKKMGLSIFSRHASGWRLPLVLLLLVPAGALSGWLFRWAGDLVAAVGGLAVFGVIAAALMKLAGVKEIDLLLGRLLRRGKA